MHRAARIAALLLGSVAALAAHGCGGGEHASREGLRLQREDLILVSRALQRVVAPVAAEVTATKAAWPLVARGLPARADPAMRRAIRTAERAAARVPLKEPFQEAGAAALTGPAAGIAGLFRVYAGLAPRGWQMIDASIAQAEHGSPAAARFARANVPLYIESVYDAHFDLAHIGKQLAAAYRKLGGAPAFASALAPAEVQALARTYSEAGARLHPHVSARLGS